MNGIVMFTRIKNKMGEVGYPGRCKIWKKWSVSKLALNRLVLTRNNIISKLGLISVKLTTW